MWEQGLCRDCCKSGYKVRAMARSATKLRGRSWADHENLEIVAADIFDPDNLLKAIIWDAVLLTILFIL